MRYFTSLTPQSLRPKATQGLRRDSSVYPAAMSLYRQVSMTTTKWQYPERKETPNMQRKKQGTRAEKLTPSMMLHPESQAANDKVPDLREADVDKDPQSHPATIEQARHDADHDPIAIDHGAAAVARAYRFLGLEIASEEAVLVRDTLAVDLVDARP
jgi:hypothetical protein